MKLFFSIIVPVYNVAPYLRECLDSVLAQTFPDWECLCVNDGSTDESGAILDEYAQKDSRFRVFHKKNEGVSATRNLGLDSAQGKWVLFLDSDDLLVNTCLERVGKSLIDKIDWMFFNAKTMTPDEKKFEDCRPQEFWDISHNQFCNNLRGQDVVWGGCFRRDWLNEHQLRFDIELKVAEDALFMSMAWIYGERVMCRGDIFGYLYRLPFGRGSLMEREAHLYWNNRLLCLKKIIELDFCNDVVWQQICNVWIYKVYLASLALPLSLRQQYEKLRTNSIVQYSDLKRLKLNQKNRMALWVWMMPQKSDYYFSLWVLIRSVVLFRCLLMKYLKNMF